MGSDLHIVPRDDLVEHDTNLDCICHPKVELVPSPSGSMMQVVIHSSLDGRETKYRPSEDMDYLPLVPEHLVRTTEDKTEICPVHNRAHGWYVCLEKKEDG